MNIVIIGGGTAGWLAAFAICKGQTNQHKLTVVESSKIGIIGAGEGSTGSLIDFLKGGFFDYQVDIDDFIKKTSATPKMGIKHVNWGIKKESYFAPLDVSPTGFEIEDYVFKYVLSKYGKEKMHIASKIGIEYENKNYNTPYALHFDGHKVGQYFKSHCLDDGVNLIDAEVVDSVLDHNGEIQHIVLNDGSIVEGDFFIDCSGFSRLLMNKVGSDFKSCSDILPVDTAMPFILPIEEEEEFVPQTTATALSAGWMWTIPLQTRKGCGYVFDSGCISKEAAQKEVEEYLGKKIEPIKFIHFESGYSEEFWKNNVLCLGLASAFVEPLEATSIHNTIVQIILFLKQYLKKNKQDTQKKIYQDNYNERIRFLNELTVDFISLHYKGGREDSEFWQKMQKKRLSDRSENILEIARHQIPSYVQLEGMYGSWSIPLLNWIFAGINKITPRQSEQELCTSSRSFTEIENKFNAYYNSIAEQKNYIIATK